jgi:hypothetical protein
MCSSAVHARTSGARLARRVERLQVAAEAEVGAVGAQQHGAQARRVPESEKTCLKSRPKSPSNGLPRAGCARLTTASPSSARRGWMT